MHDWDSSRAACRGADPNLFFPDKRAPLALKAKAICRDCPVKEPCLTEATVNRYLGVWGGTTGEERERMRRSEMRRVRISRTKGVA